MTRSPPPVAKPYTTAAHTNGYAFTQGGGYALPEYPFVPPPELTHTGPLRRHPVVIVGGGISGLTLACSLARLGLPAVLLDEDNTVGVKGASSRGICYTQKSLEIFHRLGIYERIAAKGVQWSVGRTFAGNDEVVRFDLREQDSFNLSAQPPFINIQQFYIEGFLVERIQTLGYVDLRWNNRLVAFEQTAEGATLTVDTPAGRYQIQADHVVDATGSASPLRKWLAVPFDSQRGDDRWCIADVRFTTHPPVERHTWIEAPFNDNRAVWQHLMADDVWRIDYQMAPDADPAYVSREDVVRERLARQFGPDVGVDIVWVGPYAYRSECVHHMRAGRVYFLGDSAKVVSPFGARGGNTGVSDADNLAWKLATVLSGLAAPALLEAYHAERHSAAVENVRVTGRTARFLRAPEGMERLFRTAAISLARQQPFARALINTGRMAVANPYPHSPVCAKDTGTSVQNVGFQWTDHTTGCLNDLLGWSGIRLLLLVFTPTLSPALCKTLVSLTTLTHVSAVHVLPAATRTAPTPERKTPPPHMAAEHLIDHLGHLRQACGVSEAQGDNHTTPWALVRPDGYLVGRGHGLDGNLVDTIAIALAISPLDDPHSTT